MAGTQYLLDSNILLRWVKPDHNDYPLVVSATGAILRRDDVLCYTSQNMGGFWNTCTRPRDSAQIAVKAAHAVLPFSETEGRISIAYPGLDAQFYSVCGVFQLKS
jgi:hypothetical protein